ncbi:MAG: ribonuclease HII [Bacteroidales bacterium]|nr:ribonuclease HII [Bacteroidales bacterium]
MLRSFCKEKVTEAGCDEAGRGCLAGPVFAAAVILPEDYSHPVLNDSKKLNEKARYSLRDEIEQHALAYAVALVNNEDIDIFNILRASIMAMHKALDNLKIRPQHLIIDGNRFYRYKNIPNKCIVKGDGKYFSIAAASVLAKTYRDDFMKKIHHEYPNYRWNENKGYPTRYHQEAIRKYGITKYHRKSFNLYNDQLSFDFKKPIC